MDKWQNAHMQVAQTYAQLSTAKRAQVGCVIVKDRRIISIGYNGMPSGWDNVCEFKIVIGGSFQDDIPTKLVTRKEVLHAETNAIAKLARSSESGEGADLYVTKPPCMDCAKLIYQSGISRVFYRGKYTTVEGIEFLEQAGIELFNFDD